ncbi:MAG: hypothetical protein ACOCYT_01095 [Chloroflexota bacterium]
MNNNSKRAGRPPQGTRRGRPITIYLSEPREQLFEEAFELMQEHGLLPSTANINRSRALIIDHALDALLAKLRDINN